MSSHRLRPFVALLALLAASAACASSSTTTDPAAPATTTPAPVFASTLCQDGVCWLAPTPQGNTLRAVSTTKTGTSFAVGDHGAVLRSGEGGWKALALPKRVDGDGTDRYRNLRAVHAVADDDVWIAGELGALLHFDGVSFTQTGPESAKDAENIAIWAAAKDDVWVASRRSVWRYDGTSWTEMLSASIGDVPATLVGLWGSGPDDVWVLGATTTGAVRTWHFDGTNWGSDPVPDVSNDLAPAGAPVAISGTGRGQPWLAFEYRVVARTEEGTYRTLYEIAYPDRSAASALTSLRVRSAEGVWLAFRDGHVQHSEAATKIALGAPSGGGTGLAFGDGPEGRTIVLRPGGRLADPTAPPGASRAIEGPRTKCAPAGASVVCLEAVGEKRSQLVTFEPLETGSRRGATRGPLDLAVADTTELRANARGDVVVRSGGQVFAVAGTAVREIARPNGDKAADTLLDVVLAEDGAVYATELDGALLRATVGQSSFTRTAAPQDERGCHLHQPATGTLYVSCVREVTPDVPDHVEMIVRRPDGSVVTRGMLEDRPFRNDPPVTVTASGKPAFAARLYRSGRRGVWRLDGKTWTHFEMEAQDETPVVAYGEQVLVDLRAPEDRENGAALRVIDGADVRTVRVPVHGIRRLVATRAGLLGERAEVESAGAFYSDVVTSAFVYRLP